MGAHEFSLSVVYFCAITIVLITITDNQRLKDDKD